MEGATPPHFLRTPAGDLPLDECRMRVGTGEWRVLHSAALVSDEAEADFLHQREQRLPYGVALWPSAIVLAHEVATRGEALRSTRVLELGAGTGLPGIVAASLGARVVQTDRHEVPMLLCRRNAEHNGIAGIEHRLVHWAEWADATRYDWIVGSDILYGEAMHPHLRRIFEANLAPSGRLLLADPFRATSLRLLEAMEAGGWAMTFSRWALGDERAVGVFELRPPG
jgi:methyltransferase-like protein 23